MNIRVDTTLVAVPVTVTDASGRFVLGLEKNDFEILENGVEQKVTHFSGEDAPLSVGILIDTSGSMTMKLDTSQSAARELLKTLNAQDESFLIEFNDHARLAQPFTNNTEDIEKALRGLQGGGLTALLDAVNLGVAEMKAAKNPRKVLIVISDGGDNNSRYSQDEVRSIVREADVQVYAMGVFEPALLPSLSKEEVSGPKLLGQIAEQTGGRAYGASDGNQLPSIAEKIAIELHNEYSLAYSPAEPARDGKYRKIEVRLRPQKGLPDLKVRWRLGYYAPAE
ncbi:MAG: VWA domain-containing protein [Acidobacteriota bacterium]|nr:VWA domain-containing protein [Acidobacteriota bacterium]